MTSQKSHDTKQLQSVSIYTWTFLLTTLWLNNPLLFYHNGEAILSPQHSLLEIVSKFLCGINRASVTSQNVLWPNYWMFRVEVWRTRNLSRCRRAEINQLNWIRWRRFPELLDLRESFFNHLTEKWNRWRIEVLNETSLLVIKSFASFASFICLIDTHTCGKFFQIEGIPTFNIHCAVNSPE